MFKGPELLFAPDFMTVDTNGTIRVKSELEWDYNI